LRRGTREGCAGDFFRTILTILQGTGRILSGGLSGFGFRRGVRLRPAECFLDLSNVKKHHPNQGMNPLGDAGLAFFAAGFTYVQKTSGRQPRPEKRRIAMLRAFAAAACGLLIFTGGLSALEVEATLNRVDAEKGRVVFTADQKIRTVIVARDLQVLNANGKELAGGLKATELKAGAAVTLTLERQGNKPVLKVIRLGNQRGQPAPPRENDRAESKVDTSHLTPLTDLGKSLYEGFPGGLYPEGKNQRPAAHEAAGQALARLVQPLDAEGKKSAGGKIVLLGIGFSNTVQAFAGFMQAARDDKEVNPQLVLVNGAMGGMSAHMVQDPSDQGRGTKYWSGVDDKLKAAGVTRAQVQVIWIKETNPAPHAGGFPSYIRALQAELTRIVQVLPGRFPNVKLVYLSSRSYGGWAKAPPGRVGGPGNSEPYSYETGFAVKWLIEQQLQGAAALNFDPRKGAVQAPWLSWGPYLWANGESKRQDGFSFQPSDFRDNDRMHHSPQGQRKMGTALLQFFKNDTTTREWFIKKRD
jgi:hypothetical protein